MMLRSILTICALLFIGFTFSIQAQNIITARMGYSLSSLKYPDVQTTGTLETKNHGGFHFGFGIEFPGKKNEMVSFKTGMYYTTKGVKETYEEDDSYTDGFGVTHTSRYYSESTIDLAYLEVPILVKVYVTKKEKSKIYVQAGPFLAIAVGAEASMRYEYETNQGRESGSGSVEISIGGSDGITRFDAGFHGAAGVEFNRFFISANYSYGLADINVAEGQNTTLYTRCLQLSVGFIIQEEASK